MADRTTLLQSHEVKEGPGPLSFFLIYAVTGSFLLLAMKGGYYTLVAPLAATFVAVPLLDWAIGVDTRNRATPPRAFTTAISGLPPGSRCRFRSAF